MCDGVDQICTGLVCSFIEEVSHAFSEADADLLLAL